MLLELRGAEQSINQLHTLSLLLRGTCLHDNLDLPAIVGEHAVLDDGLSLSFFGEELEHAAAMGVALFARHRFNSATRVFSHGQDGADAEVLLLHLRLLLLLHLLGCDDGAGRSARVFLGVLTFLDLSLEEDIVLVDIIMSHHLVIIFVSHILGVGESFGLFLVGLLVRDVFDFSEKVILFEQASDFLIVLRKERCDGLAIETHLAEEAAVCETLTTTSAKLFDRLFDGLGIIGLVHETVSVKTERVYLKVSLIFEDLFQFQYLIIHLVDDGFVCGTSVILKLFDVDLEILKTETSLRALFYVLAHLDFFCEGRISGKQFLHEHEVRLRPLGIEVTYELLAVKDQLLS